MNIKNRKQRKAISPVLATVILIAITLIAAIAIAGFVFGLFGSFTSSAQVSGQVISCTTATYNSSKAFCAVRLTNSGTSNAVANACSLQIGGVAQVGTLGGTKAIPAGGNAILHCTGTTAGNAVGSQALGSFSTSNGASVPFTGVWS